MVAHFPHLFDRDIDLAVMSECYSAKHPNANFNAMLYNEMQCSKCALLNRKRDEECRQWKSRKWKEDKTNISSD
jgi:hypothetical protein